MDEGELRAKILLTKSNIHDALGETDASTAALLEAAPLIDSEREPRMALIVRFNLVVDLCDQENAEEAQPRLAEVRRSAERIGEELDLTRCVWLEGKTAAGLGQKERARHLFEQVRRAFQAARRESATVELTRSVLRFLQRAQYDPELRFDGSQKAGAS